MAESEQQSRTYPPVGSLAPDFTLPTHSEGELNLSWYRGRRNVLLAFYPGDWTPLCATQIPVYNRLLDEFEAFDCQVLAVSVDSIPCHLAWSKSLGGIEIPLMSDYWPHGAVATKYGVLTDRGYTDRVVFLIDKEGRIRYIEEVAFAEEPDNTEIFRQLAKLHEEQQEQATPDSGDRP
jgi:peroxiredoxin (alkyl hydroperoxide reductase subunit C)